MGLVSMSAVGYLLTGSIGTGGQIAVIGAGVGFAGYMLHESAWSRVRWGRA